MADMTLNQPAVAHEHDAHGEDHNENIKFAVWLYLASEIVIFTMLIAAYVIFRATQPTSVSLVHDALGIALVTANTFILLASSYAMVMGLRAIEMGNRQGFYQWIGLTAVLGTVFVGGQYIEYSELGHLNVSLRQQEFTVSTNLFESVNEVEAIVTYSVIDSETGELIGTADTELIEVREEALPAESETVLDNGTTEIVAVTSYLVDFANNADLFEGVDVANFEIQWDQDFILLDTSVLPMRVINDPNVIESELIAYNDGARDRFISLDRVAVETVDGQIVPFSAIFAGQAVELAPNQYDNLNAYFQKLLGDSASNYGMRFYAPTAFHGAHVIVGVLWALYLLFQGSRGAYDENSIGVEVFGLYWHFVDVVWIALFTLIYLV
ncbi:MAG: heme-copper oxidase subunit III [Phototrophicaceae bacterium]